MSKKTEVTLANHVVNINDVDIPDMWFLYLELKKSPKYKHDAEDLLKTWHIAHALKRHIEKLD